MKLLLALLCVFVFAPFVLAEAAPSDKAAEELDIREATFRYQFVKNASGLKERAGAYYLSVAVKEGENGDPKAEFLKRFADNKPPVKAGSECTTSPEKGVVDKKTGEQGLCFHTGAVKWISETEVEISGGYYEGGLSSSGNIYFLEKVDGKWKVLRDVMRWIS